MKKNPLTVPVLCIGGALIALPFAVLFLLGLSLRFIRVGFLLGWKVSGMLMLHIIGD